MLFFIFGGIFAALGIILVFGALLGTHAISDLPLYIMYIIIGAVLVLLGINRRRSAKSRALHRQENASCQSAESSLASDLSFHTAANISNPVVRAQAKELTLISFNQLADLQKRYIAFDLETTGLNSNNDKILEISAVIFENWIPINHFSTFINPEIHIPSRISEINHIFDYDVKDAPTISEGLRLFFDFVGEDALSGNVPFVAHNASFDIHFLSSSITEEVKFNYFDTLRMSRDLQLPTKNKKLSTLANYYSIDQEMAHRAGDDARVCGLIFAKMVLSQGDVWKNRFNLLPDSVRSCCLWFKSVLGNAHVDINRLTFIYTKSGYLHVGILGVGGFLKLKPIARTPYLLWNVNDFFPDSLLSVPASKSEGENMIRIQYNDVSDLSALTCLFADRFHQLIYSSEYEINENDRNQVYFQMISI